MNHVGRPIHPEPIEAAGPRHAASVSWNLEPARLVEIALTRGEGRLSATGALVVRTGKFTGRSPGDKYIVHEPSTESGIWWGPVNQSLSEENFGRLHARITEYLEDKELFAQDLYGGAEIGYRLPVRVITEYAWHSLFARQLLVRPSFFENQDPPDRVSEQPAFTILCAPGCKADPQLDGTKSETFIVIHLAKRLVLIGGTEYAGEIKKTVFTLLNYLLPRHGVFPMHCSANIGRRRNDTALFFGLSGTGKTTLSADPHRDLIGDDEHAWAKDGVFNFEGGCYAKCIRLSEQAEPEIWRAIRFGSVLENVVMDEDTRVPDFETAKYTENTRVAYPIDFIPNARIPGIGGIPNNVVFLTADAFGVLPPISRLTNVQARFHFLSGYTAKVAGTERGLGNEPQATFSTCFGQPFLPLHPSVYSRLLGEKLEESNATVWMVNTGWSGGPYGVGHRMNIHHTRAMLQAALDGLLDDAEFQTDPIFNLAIPNDVPGVPCQVLNPRDTWSDPLAYDARARHLADLFRQNIEKFRSEAASDIMEGAPNG